MVRESHSTPRSASDASAQLGDVAYLTVTAVNSTGAFLRWVQPKGRRWDRRRSSRPR